MKNYHDTLDSLRDELRAGEQSLSNQLYGSNHLTKEGKNTLYARVQELKIEIVKMNDNPPRSTSPKIGRTETPIESKQREISQNSYANDFDLDGEERYYQLTEEISRLKNPTA